MFLGDVFLVSPISKISGNLQAERWAAKAQVSSAVPTHLLLHKHGSAVLAEMQGALDKRQIKAHIIHVTLVADEDLPGCQEKSR